MEKAVEIPYGRALKRKATNKHTCYYCGRNIKPGVEFHQLSIERCSSVDGPKHICERCWMGTRL